MTSLPLELGGLEAASGEDDVVDAGRRAEIPEGEGDRTRLIGIAPTDHRIGRARWKGRSAELARYSTLGVAMDPMLSVKDSIVRTL